MLIIYITTTSITRNFFSILPHPWHTHNTFSTPPHYTTTAHQRHHFLNTATFTKHNTFSILPYSPNIKLLLNYHIHHTMLLNTNTTFTSHKNFTILHTKLKYPIHHTIHSLHYHIHYTKYSRYTTTFITHNTFSILTHSSHKKINYCIINTIKLYASLKLY